FLVKYSFENNLITPGMRVAIGTVVGLGLIATGWFTAARNYRVSGQSLCATGVLVLYGNIFAAHVFYDLIELGPAFASMAIVTAAAFFLAVRMNAQVIVILGLLGGFLTPVLLSTGVDNPTALFGYIAVLNIGVAAIALSLAALAWGFCLLSYQALGFRPSFLFSYIFLAEVGLLGLALLHAKRDFLVPLAGGIVFVFLGSWTANYLIPSLLWWALGGYVVFSILHAGFAVWPASTEPAAKKSPWPSYLPL